MDREEEIRREILRQAKGIKEHTGLAFPDNQLTNEIAGELITEKFLIGSVDEYGLACITGIRDKGREYLANPPKKETTMQKEITVFYAWQSDSPEKDNHYLIRDALDEAIKEYNARQDARAKLALDHDTKGVGGTPDVTFIILGKISKCGIFVADVTFVGSSWTTDENGKQEVIPNPNVFFELGYAMAKKDYQQVVLVMNDHYGSPENLPFDFQNKRWPIRYTLKPGDAAARKSVTQKLKRDLLTALDTTLRGDVFASLLASDSVPPDAIFRARERVDEFHARLKAGEFCSMNVTDGCLASCVIPAGELAATINLSDMVPSQNNLAKPIGDDPALCAPEIGSRYLRYKHIEVNSSMPPRHASELLDTGEVYSASTYFVYQQQAGEPGLTRSIPIAAIQEMVSKSVLRYLRLQDLTKQTAGCFIGISFLNLVKCTLAHSNLDPFDGRNATGDVRPDPVYVKRPELVTSIDGLRELLKPSFDFIWRKFGRKRSL